MSLILRGILFSAEKPLSLQPSLLRRCFARAAKNEPAMKTNKIARSFFLRLATTLTVVLFFFIIARAGGPEYVAGPSYFNSSTMGQPVTWSLGQVNYYTDQGALSPILANDAANSFVANAFSQWTAVSTAALTVNAAGQLAEDVNGSNIE